MFRKRLPNEVLQKDELELWPHDDCFARARNMVAYAGVVNGRDLALRLAEIIAQYMELDKSTNKTGA